MIIDVLGEQLIENAHLYGRPELCAWAKFVGQGLGLRYFGVLQSDRDGRVYVTTRTAEEQFLVAEGIDELVPLLLNPSKVPRKAGD